MKLYSLFVDIKINEKRTPFFFFMIKNYTYRFHEYRIPLFSLYPFQNFQTSDLVFQINIF